jgi:hypothetical protein
VHKPACRQALKGICALLDRHSQGQSDDQMSSPIDVLLECMAAGSHTVIVR